MFLESITVIHLVLSMHEMSRMHMTRTGAEVIISRTNVNKKYYESQNKCSQRRTNVRLDARDSNSTANSFLHMCFLSFYID